MTKLEIFLEGCKLSVISHIISSLITQSVCKMGTSRKAPQCALEQYIIVLLFDCSINDGTRMPADVLSHSKTTTQTVVQENSSVIKSKLQSLNLKAQLS